MLKDLAIDCGLSLALLGLWCGFWLIKDKRDSDRIARARAAMRRASEDN